MPGILDPRSRFKTVDDRYSRPPSSPVDDAYGAYSEAATGQDQDYSNIMKKFGDIYDTGGFGSSFQGYEMTPEYKDALSRLTGLANTGGFSPEDIANIRERAISPIRAVYANANRNVARQRRLQGGYSPNFTAATTKMARDMSSQLSDASIRANAEIAQDVARNKISTTGTLAGLTAEDQARRNEYNLIPMKNKFSALSGMANLYGTTPARESLRGRQALETADLTERAKMNRFNRRKSILDMYDR